MIYETTKSKVESINQRNHFRKSKVFFQDFTWAFMTRFHNIKLAATYIWTSLFI